MVVELNDGTVRKVVPARWQCPVSWSSDSTIWSVEGTEGRYVWVERDVDTGAKTGRRSELTSPVEDGQCQPPPHSGVSASPTLRIEVEERADVLRVPGAD